MGGLLAGVAGVLLGTLTPPTTTGYTLVLIGAVAIALLAKFQSFIVMLVTGMGVGIGQAILLRYDQSLQQLTKLSGWGDALPLLIILGVVLFGGQAIAAKGNRVERPLPDVPVASSPLSTAGVGLIVGVLWYTFAPLYLINYTTTSVDLAIVAFSLVVLVGYTGQISLMQMTVAGFGAWAAARTASDLGVPFPLTIVIAAIGGGLLALVVGAPAVRVRGINLAVVTLAVAIVMDDMFFSDPGLAGADAGLPMPTATIFGIQLNGLSNPRNLGIVALVVLILLGLCVYAVRRSALGQRMVAVRANERGAAATGIDVARTKIAAFMIAGAIAGVAGSLEAYRTVQTNWESFSFFTSITIIAFAYLGGATYIAGAIVAGLVAPGGLVAGILHFQGTAEQILNIIGGVGVISIVLAHPAGLAPDLQRLYRRLLRVVPRGPFINQPATAGPAPGSPPMGGPDRVAGKLREVEPVERLR
jgi:ABC-type branched-subunit amino acid transport system permease subunit